MFVDEASRIELEVAARRNEAIKPFTEKFGGLEPFSPEHQAVMDALLLEEYGHKVAVWETEVRDGKTGPITIASLQAAHTMCVETQARIDKGSTEDRGYSHTFDQASKMTTDLGMLPDGS